MPGIASQVFVEQQLIGPYVVGEIPTPIQITIEDSDGAAMNLSGYTAEFVIVRLDDTTPAGVPAGASSIVNEDNGITQYVWHEDDFQESGNYRGVMWVSNGTLRFTSVFYEWYVRDSGTTPSI